MNSPEKAEDLSFEQSMQELEQIVVQMEQGDLSLEQALGHFERGVQLARVGESKLQQAEQKVQILMQQDGESQLADLEAPQDPKANQE